jgi:hypothetical protein
MTDHAENTAPKQQIGRPFKPGQSGNPAGRPDSRNRISETFLNALVEDFDQHGIAMIGRVREERPYAYLKVVVAVLPRDMSLSVSTQQRRAEESSYEELTAIIRGQGAASSLLAPITGSARTTRRFPGGYCGGRFHGPTP